MNRGNLDYERVPDYFKMTSLLNIQWACNYLKEDPTETMYLARKAVDSDVINSGCIDIVELQLLMECLIEKLDSANQITSSSNPLEGQYFLDDRLGHVFVNKIMNKTDNRIHPFSSVAKFEESSGAYCLYYFKEEEKNGVSLYLLSPCTIYAKQGKYIKRGDQSLKKLLEKGR